MKLSFAFWILLTSFSFAATKYVSPGGTGSGASWSAPGSVSVVNSSGAGDTVYLAGGNYSGGFTISGSGSASSPLTIKRATALDHGADAGWSGQMDSQVVFKNGFTVSGKYVILDGNTWKPPGLPAQFGILIKHGDGETAIYALNSSNVIYRNLDIAGAGMNADTLEADGILLGNHTTVSGCSVHDCDAGFKSRDTGMGPYIFEYSFIYNISSIIYQGHGQGPHPDFIYSSAGWIDGSVMRYCVCANCVSEGVFYDNGGPGGKTVFYGNLFFQGDTAGGCVPVEYQNGPGPTFGPLLYYNNTWVDWSKSNTLGGGTAKLASGSKFQNNLFVNCDTDWPRDAMSYNGFWGTAHPGGSNTFTGDASPFNGRWKSGSAIPPATRINNGSPPGPEGYDPAQYVVDFALVAGNWASGQGTALGAPYNVDMFGHSGNNLGAFQPGGSGGPTPTPAPTATPAPTPTPGNKFKAGDTVTPTAEVNVRQGPGGPVIGQHQPGDIGTVVSGPELAPLPQATTVAWYMINWTSAPASGYTGDDDLAKTAAPTPTPTPAPTPVPTPSPGVTYKEWTIKLNAEQTKWIETHPPYPDSE